MSDIAIRVCNVSKRYRIGKRQRYQALRDTLTDAAVATWRALRSMGQRGNGSMGQWVNGSVGQWGNGSIGPWCGAAGGWRTM
jgi:hypothetical protein